MYALLPGHPAGEKGRAPPVFVPPLSTCRFVSAPFRWLQAYRSAATPPIPLGPVDKTLAGRGGAAAGDATTTSIPLPPRVFLPSPAAPAKRRLLALSLLGARRTTEQVQTSYYTYVARRSWPGLRFRDLAGPRATGAYQAARSADESCVVQEARIRDVVWCILPGWCHHLIFAPTCRGARPRESPDGEMGRVVCRRSAADASCQWHL